MFVFFFLEGKEEEEGEKREKEKGEGVTERENACTVVIVVVVVPMYCIVHICLERVNVRMSGRRRGCCTGNGRGSRSQIEGKK